MKNSAQRVALLFAIALAARVDQVLAQANFYEGKTARFIVGFSAGGGYDTYTRLIARHLGKHVPGHPVFVVDNMAGAGSMISADVGGGTFVDVVVLDGVHYASLDHLLGQHDVVV